MKDISMTYPHNLSVRNFSYWKYQFLKIFGLEPKLDNLLKREKQ